MSLHPIETRLASAWPPSEWLEVTVLLAVSGGADSVAMLRAMAALKTAAAGGYPGRIGVAHVNHQLRGGESDADEALVADLCRRLDLPCEVGRVGGLSRFSCQRKWDCPLLTHDSDRVPSRGGQGLESAARRARYAFLQEAAARTGARYVVTAHTADDQAETILHHILRGTGLRGLAGISRARPLGPATLLRPMLCFRRAELAAYLDDLGQPCRQDSSNRDPQFTRNRIRHELLPRLAEQFNPNVAEALVRLGALAGEAQAVVDRWAADLIERWVRPAGPDAVAIDRPGLASQPRYIVRELLIAVWRRQAWPMQAMGFQQWDLLAAMVLPPTASSGGTSAKHVFPGGVEAEVSVGKLRLSRPGELNRLA
ncbi:MAG: tRNA lysidine(34) synthetase TilS [Thermoguttaceae bacterium]|jgi:tRNA(Ile)-lysidine synthase